MGHGSKRQIRLSTRGAQGSPVDSLAVTARNRSWTPSDPQDWEQAPHSAHSDTTQFSSHKGSLPEMSM